MSDEDDEMLDGEQFGLVMPFLPVASRGGPLDDLAYVCGWEAADIAHALKAGQGVPVALALPVHTENVEQLDLVAMQYGFTMERRPWDGDPGWTFVRFTPDDCRGAPEAP